MLYICIPVYNEAPTIGVLLWRIRATFQEHARDYELVVYDDGSTDATAEVLEPYTKVLPLTILSGRERRGYAAAVDTLYRHVAAHTRYPRRDAVVLMQGDFTDRPEHLPELARRFEGGADIVATERSWAEKDPTSPRRLRRLAPWLLRPFVRIEGIADLTSGYRLVRISLLRDLLRERGDAPLVAADGWAANAELLLALAPYARRIESIAVEPRYDVRPRESRLRAASDALALARFGWGARALARRASAAPRHVAGPGARPTETLREVPAPTPPDAAPDVAPAALALAEGPEAAASSRRRKRARREGRADRPEAAEAPVAPTDRLDDVAAPEPARRQKPKPRAPRAESAAAALENALDSAADDAFEAAPAAEASESAASEERRRRRRSRRAARRDAAETAGDGVLSVDAAPAPESTAAGDDAARDDASSDADAFAEPADGETPARTGRRSRRSRKRRSATSEAGTSEAGTSETFGEAGPEGSPASDATTSEPEFDAAPGDGESESDVAPRSARRSRRGRRRGGRSRTQEQSGEAGPGGDSGESAPPSADSDGP